MDVNEIWPIETQDPKSSSCPVIWTKTFPHPLPRRNTPAVKFLINDSQIQKKISQIMNISLFHARVCDMKSKYISPIEKYNIKLTIQHLSLTM